MSNLHHDLMPFNPSWPIYAPPHQYNHNSNQFINNQFNNTFYNTIYQNNCNDNNIRGSINNHNNYQNNNYITNFNDNNNSNNSINLSKLNTIGNSNNLSSLNISSNSNHMNSQKDRSNLNSMSTQNNMNSLHSTNNFATGQDVPFMNQQYPFYYMPQQYGQGVYVIDGNMHHRYIHDYQQWIRQYQAWYGVDCPTPLQSQQSGSYGGNYGMGDYAQASHVPPPTFPPPSHQSLPIISKQKSSIPTNTNILNNVGASKSGPPQLNRPSPKDGPSQNNGPFLNNGPSQSYERMQNIKPSQNAGPPQKNEPPQNKWPSQKDWSSPDHGNTDLDQNQKTELTQNPNNALDQNQNNDQDHNRSDIDQKRSNDLQQIGNDLTQNRDNLQQCSISLGLQAGILKGSGNIINLGSSKYIQDLSPKAGPILQGKTTTSYIQDQIGRDLNLQGKNVSQVDQSLRAPLKENSEEQYQSFANPKGALGLGNLQGCLQSNYGGSIGTEEKLRSQNSVSVTSSCSQQLRGVVMKPPGQQSIQHSNKLSAPPGTVLTWNLLVFGFQSNALDAKVFNNVLNAIRSQSQEIVQYIRRLDIKREKKVPHNKYAVVCFEDKQRAIECREKINGLQLVHGSFLKAVLGPEPTYTTPII